jgi:hypothetical protein
VNYHTLKQLLKKPSAIRLTIPPSTIAYLIIRVPVWITCTIFYNSSPTNDGQLLCWIGMRARSRSSSGQQHTPSTISNVTTNSSNAPSLNNINNNNWIDDSKNDDYTTNGSDDTPNKSASLKNENRSANRIRLPLSTPRRSVATSTSIPHSYVNPSHDILEHIAMC